MQDRQGVPDLMIFIVTLALLGIGIVMVFSASQVMAFHELGDPYYYLKRQSAWAVIGIVALVVMMNIDYRVWKKFAIPMLIGTFALLGLVLVPGIGIVAGGARRWLGVGLMRMQPSELAKLSVVVFLAAYLSGPVDRVKGFIKGVMIPMGLVGAMAVLILKEPDLGTSVAIAGVAWLMLLSAGCKLSHLFGVGLFGLPAVIYLIFSEPYRLRRLTAFIRPWDDPLDSGFHIIQSLLALGSGGLVGLGLGLSRQKHHYLPEQHTDFIFAIIGEELGFIGAGLVVLLYLLFAWRGYRTALNAPDRFGSLLATGVTTMVVLQAVINIGVVSGCLPVTGITLPLISSGGSSLVPMLAGIGMLINISRHVRQS